MGTHFGAIGFGPDPADVPDQLQQLLGGAQLLGTSDDDQTRVYRHADPSGSSATVTIVDGRVTCLTTGLMPGRRIAATCVALLEDDCPYERPVQVDAVLGDLEIPLAITIDDLALSGPELAAGRGVELAVAALAEQINVFADESAYRASGTPMSVESLIPSGLFAPGTGGDEEFRASSRMLMSGVVTTCEWRQHGLFGHAFVVALVRSMGGDWQVGIDPADLPDALLPPVGAVVSGSFWLSGHLAS